MENCQNGCPCKYFDCELSLDDTDHVKGPESMGVLETTGSRLAKSLSKLEC